METGEDFISSLPEDVLRYIVSLIPSKEALKTALLSTQWRKLWMLLPVYLELNSNHKLPQESKQKLRHIIGELLKSYDQPERLKLCLHSEYYSKVNEELFAIVTRGTHKDLHFDFSSSKNSTSRFNLILDQLGPQNWPEFSSLKSLQLRFVQPAAETLVSELFSSFQFLENLSIEKCRGLQNIDLKANEFLTSLKILDCCSLENIKISAPGLKKFTYRGHLPQIESIDAPNLVEVSMDLRDGVGDKEFDCEDVLGLLYCIKDVEILTISGWLLEWLCTAGVIFESLEFKFNSLKQLWCVISAIDKNKRNSIACFLNATPVLEKLFIQIDPKCMGIELPPPYFYSCWHDQHLWMDSKTVKRNASPLKLLKQIELVGFTCKNEDEVLLMDLLLHKAANVQSMLMISPNMDTWKLSVVPSSQLSFQMKLHRRCMVVPSPNGNYSSYLFTEGKRL